MEPNRAKQIIVDILQTALSGKLDSSCNFNPQAVADAIAVKINFEKTYNNFKSDEITGSIIDFLNKCKKEMNEQLNDNNDNIFLSNFIRGKITAYDEILSILNTL